MTPEPVVEPGTEPAATEHAAGRHPADPTLEAALASRRAMPRRWLGRRGLAVSVGVATLVVMVDQVSKHWVVSSLGDRPRHVIWTLQFNQSHNSGMAFSTGQGIGPIIGAVAIVVVVALAMSVRRVGSPLAVIAAGLVTGGAIGNLTDRLFRGRGWLHGSVIDLPYTFS